MLKKLNPFAKDDLKVIIVYPSKKVIMKKVSSTKETFTIGQGIDSKSYVIDEKAIYFFKKEPLLFYHSNNPSPLLIKVEGQSESMSASEFQSIIESKAVKDLLTAQSAMELNLSLILTIVNTLGIVFLIAANSGFFGG